MKTFHLTGKASFLFYLSLILFAHPLLAQQAPEKSSPFTAVKWDGDSPQVQFEGEWFLFESLDGITSEQILSHAKEKHGNRWQKRFSEDLVEILGEMGHQPKTEVTLVLSQGGTTMTKNGIMSEDNRRSVWNYNQKPDEEIARQSGERIRVKESNTGASGITVTTEDTPANQRIARQFGEHIDAIWDQPPTEGKGNLRFLIKKGGKLHAGPLTLHTEFTFSATGRRGQYLTQGFNSNQNGRWVYEEMMPDTYDLVINGVGPFEGWSWTKDGVEVKAGEMPLFEIEVNQ